MRAVKKNSDSFIQEHLYIEEFPLLPLPIPNESKEEKIERGVYIYEIFSPDKKKK